MTTSILFFIIGCALGAIVALFVQMQKHAAERLNAERAKVELETLQKQKEEEANRYAELKEEHRKLRDEHTTTYAELESRRTALEKELKQHEELAQQHTVLTGKHDDLRNEYTSLQKELASLKTELQKELKQHEELALQHAVLTGKHDDLRNEYTGLQKELASLKTELQKEQELREGESAKMEEMQKKHFAQFENLANEILEKNAGKLKETNQESMGTLLKPLRDQLENLGKAVNHTNETAAGNKASLESAIKAMMEKTESLGRDAENLTLALRGDTKKQGDWGEMILERMLEESGLRKGEEYFTQENHKTEEGRDVRPDVIIRFPDKRCVVVDSKVSLTAYAMYCGAEKEEERQMYLTQHVASVRKHINELATKDYSSIVEDTISYVLMFMPNEASYMAALQACNDLQMEAYRRRVILISPTNLLMALQLAYNLWQKERQTRNVQQIFKRATSLYEKMCNVQESMEKVGNSLRQAQDAYTKATDQLFRGRGNYSRQLEDLRQMGISTAKQLRLEDDTSESD